MGQRVPPISVFPRKIVVEPWNIWFAWRPVKIHGRRKWLTSVYRRCIVCYQDMDKWHYYEYGTIFDVMK